jgi:hypothetical protein
VDLHHIQYWSNGGRTKLDNLVSLCVLCRRRHKTHYAELLVMPCGAGFPGVLAGYEVGFVVVKSA